jgi:hypothetical protein
MARQESDVLGDAQVGEGDRLLVNERQPRGSLAVREANLAAVGLVEAGEDLDQCRLSCAVLAEEAVDLSPADIEVRST